MLLLGFFYITVSSALAEREIRDTTAIARSRRSAYKGDCLLFFIPIFLQ